MEFTTAVRLLLLFAHLMLCVFALYGIVRTDWRLLRSRISARQLNRTHFRTLWLLTGLWATGLMIIGIDTGFVWAEIMAKPKLVAKLVCVTLLSANGLLLRMWCFPRLAGRQPMGRAEATALMVCGGISTTSWLMAAFLGIAKPLQVWSITQCLSLYGAALLAVLPVALLLERRLRDGRIGRHAANNKGTRQKASVPSGGDMDTTALKPSAG